MSNIPAKKNKTNPRKKSRRTFLRIAAGVSATAAVTASGVRVLSSRQPAEPMEKATVLDICNGCTGCVCVCPTGAIMVEPDRISIIQDKCISCGYCSAICSVNGIHIHSIKAYD